jgi:hypothetical protein
VACSEQPDPQIRGWVILTATVVEGLRALYLLRKYARDFPYLPFYELVLPALFPLIVSGSCLLTILGFIGKPVFN